jgi:hypothetical protein
MLWIGTTVALVICIVALMVVSLVDRPIDVEAFGSVSNHWIAEHRADSP